jgi:hypothetical protein
MEMPSKDRTSILLLVHNQVAMKLFGPSIMRIQVKHIFSPTITLPHPSVEILMPILLRLF